MTAFGKWLSSSLSRSLVRESIDATQDEAKFEGRIFSLSRSGVVDPIDATVTVETETPVASPTVSAV